MTWAEKWLGSGEDYGYIQLVSSCSAMLMGSKTFDFELAAIGNQDRILPTYVLTMNPQRYDGVHGDVKLVAGDVSAVVDRVTDAHTGRHADAHDHAHHHEHEDVGVHDSGEGMLAQHTAHPDGVPGTG
jgi:hypothetical protein